MGFTAKDACSSQHPFSKSFTAKDAKDAKEKKDHCRERRGRREEE
jgi:hypothetical protein